MDKEESKRLPIEEAIEAVEKYSEEMDELIEEYNETIDMFNIKSADIIGNYVEESISHPDTGEVLAMNEYCSNQEEVEEYAEELLLDYLFKEKEAAKEYFPSKEAFKKEMRKRLEKGRKNAKTQRIVM